MVKRGREITVLTTRRCQIKYTQKKLHSANWYCLIFSHTFIQFVYLWLKDILPLQISPSPTTIFCVCMIMHACLIHFSHPVQLRCAINFPFKWMWWYFWHYSMDFFVTLSKINIQNLVQTEVSLTVFYSIYTHTGLVKLHIATQLQFCYDK